MTETDSRNQAYKRLGEVYPAPFLQQLGESLNKTVGFGEPETKDVGGGDWIKYTFPVLVSTGPKKTPRMIGKYSVVIDKIAEDAEAQVLYNGGHPSVGDGEILLQAGVVPVVYHVDVGFLRDLSNAAVQQLYFPNPIFDAPDPKEGIVMLLQPKPTVPRDARLYGIKFPILPLRHFL